MPNERHRVGIVVDGSFKKEKLRKLATKMHVWLIESEENQSNADFVMTSEQFNEDDLLADGITTFVSPDIELTPPMLLDYVLEEVELHHNEHSHDPGWSEVHVYGVNLDDSIVELFEEFGFSIFIKHSDQSFIAQKECE